jgi:hypothetical protein
MAEKDSLGSIEERLALLEDRTKPKKKDRPRPRKGLGGCCNRHDSAALHYPLRGMGLLDQNT